MTLANRPAHQIKIITMSVRKLLEKSAHDIVILSAVRTPITKAKKGGLKDTYPEEILRTAIRGAVEKSGVDKSEVNDVLVGAVLQSLGGQKASALAVKSLGFPPSTTVNTVNRQCASSAQAMSYVANTIRAGEIDLGIAAGVESMTHDYFATRGIPNRVSQSMYDAASDDAKAVLMPMGITSENVAKEFGVSRSDQDDFAYQSHLRAAKATESGHFAKEIVPVETRFIEEDGTEKQVTITKDDGIRATIKREKLAELKPVFADDGTTTAGNSSQISDGAAAMVLTTRAHAEKLGIKPVGRFIGSAVAGVPAHLMGIGPAEAVPKLMNRLGLQKSDIDVYELNEAFASQSVYVVNKLGLDLAKVNPNGGAIALGHPLGATGARITATLLNDLDQLNGELGVMSMCMSTGMGYAAVLARE